MARSALVINLNLEERMILERLAFDPTNPQLAKRAGIVLDSANGMLGKDIAQKYSVNESKVTKWRNRYLSDGPKGLLRQRPVKDDSQLTNEEVIELIRETIDEPPPEGESSWTSVLVAEKLGISIQKCKRLLTEASITLERVRSFSVISDSIGPTNCVGIVGIYLSNKQCALILDVGRHITVEDKPRSVLDTRNREASEEYKQLFSQGENLCMSKVLDTATSFLGKGIPYRTRLSCGDFIQRTIADLSNPIGNSNYRVLLWTEEHSKETVTIMDSSIDLIHTSDLNKWNTEVQAVANMCGLALDDPQHNQFFVPSVGCFVSASSDVDEPFCWHRVNGTDVQEHVCEQASVPLAVAVNPGNMVISISYLGTDGKEIITSTTEYPVDIPDPANVHINSKDAAVPDFGFFERGVNAAVQQAECDFSASYAEKVKKNMNRSA